MIFAALQDKPVDSNVNERALALKIITLGEILPRTIQECDKWKYAWDKLQSRYAGKTFVKNRCSKLIIKHQDFGKL